MSDVALRSIELFAGGGGLALGLEAAGVRTVCFVERESYAAAVLAARMAEGRLAPAPIWSDVCTFDGRPWRGVVDLVAGGFPCQDVSQAGKRAGVADGERSGLWREFARIVGEVGPEFVFVENVGALVVRGLDIVLGDLAALGFDAEWGCVLANEAGAPHRRERVFILAHSRRGGAERRQRRGEVSGPPPPARAPPEREWGGAGARDGGEDGSRRLALPKRIRLQRQLGAGAAAGPVERSGGAEVADADGGGRGRGAGSEVPGSDGPTTGDARRVQVPPGRSSDDRCVFGDPHRRGREGGGVEERDGLEGEPGRLALRSGSHGRLPWPPGPGDADGWRDYLDRWPGTEPAVRRGADGLAHRVDRLRLLGNGVVPDQAALAFRILAARLGVTP